MQLDPDPARLYRLMRRVGVATLPVGILGGIGVGIAFGPVSGLIIGVVLVSMSLYQAVAFPYVDERLRRRVSASQDRDKSSDRQAS